MSDEPAPPADQKPPGATSPEPEAKSSEPEATSPEPEAKSPHPPTEIGRLREKGPANPDEIALGGEIAGYRLEEQIGEGGMAVVYRARDERLGRRVALKLLAAGLAADTGFRQRFINESRAAAAVDHPNIIPIYEAGNAGGTLFIAMRYVQGGDVRSLLEQGGPLSAARAWAIVGQAAAALDAAHAHGLIHRDVKPANLLLDARAAADGPGRRSPAADLPEHVYLSDFGISKQPLAASNLTMTGQFVGTLDYIAPEQIDGHHVDGRADLYSLGCATFELLSGTPPFRRGPGLALITAHLSEPPPSLTARRGDLPAAVDRVLAAAMAKSPDDRYATCAQFATDLGRSLGLIPGEPEPPGRRDGARTGPGAADHLRPWPAAGLAGVAPGTAIDRHQQAAMAPAGQAAAGIHDGQQPPAGGAWPSGPHEPSGPSGPYGPSGPAWPSPAPAPPAPARRSRGLIAGLIAAAVAVGAAAVAVAVVLAGHGHVTPQSAPSSPVASASPASSASPATGASAAPAASAASSASPAPAPSSSAEAAAVSSLLTSGAASSTDLSTAADNVQDCTDLSPSVQQIQQVRNQRQAEYDQAQNLSTEALQDGAQLKIDLTQALFYSLKADNDYLTWAHQQASECQVGSESSAAIAAGDQAVSYKVLFVGIWNPIAVQYGLPQTSKRNI